jgi:hypothetical protein
MFSIRLRSSWFASLALALMLAVPAVSQATTVRMQTSLGVVDIQL